MKKATVVEKFRLCKVKGGYRTVPLDPGSITLLSDICGGEQHVNDLVKMKFKALVADIIEIAHSRRMTVQVCGNRNAEPVFILRKTEYPSMQVEYPDAKLTRDWELRVNSVYGNPHFQLACVRPAGSGEWWTAWQAPADLLNGLRASIDGSMDFAYDSGRTDSALWDVFAGKRKNVVIGSLKVYFFKVVNPPQSGDRHAIARLKLKKGVPASRTYRMNVSASCDLKYGCFYDHPGDWQESGYSHIVSMLENLTVGQTLKIDSAPSKEIRYSSVSVTCLSACRWLVDGYIVCSWDDHCALAGTLGVYLLDDDESLPGDGSVEAVDAFLAKMSDECGEEYATISCDEAFRESIPYSWHSMEPGVDWDFSKVVRGSFLDILKYLSLQEYIAMAHDQEEWDGVESVYRHPEK